MPERTPLDPETAVKQSLVGKDVTLRHFETPDSLKKSWAPWAERMGVRRLITGTGLELWPNRDPSLDREAA